MARKVIDIIYNFVRKRMTLKGDGTGITTGNITNLPNSAQVERGMQEVFRHLKGANINPTLADEIIKNEKDLGAILNRITQENNRRMGKEGLREFTRREDLYEGLPSALRNVKNPEEVKRLLESGDIQIGKAPKTKKNKPPVDPKFKRAVESQEERARLIREFEKRNKEAAYNIAFKRYKEIDKRPMEMDELVQIYTNLGKYPKGKSIIIDDIADIQRGYILPAIGNRSREMLVGKLNQMVRPTKKQPNPFDKAPDLKEGEQIEMDFTDWDPKGMEVEA